MALMTDRTALLHILQYVIAPISCRQQLIPRVNIYMRMCLPMVRVQLMEEHTEEKPARSSTWNSNFM
jgi:hypothetical protein